MVIMQLIEHLSRLLSKQTGVTVLTEHAKHCWRVPPQVILCKSAHDKQEYVTHSTIMLYIYHRA